MEKTSKKGGLKRGKCKRRKGTGERTERGKINDPTVLPRKRIPNGESPI